MRIVKLVEVQQPKDRGVSIMDYLESLYVFKRVGDFIVKSNFSFINQNTFPLFRAYTRKDGFGQVLLKVKTGGVVELVIKYKESVTEYDSDNYYPYQYPEVFKESISSEQLATILKNPASHRNGSIYKSLIPLLISIENLTKDFIKGNNVEYYLGVNFVKGKIHETFLDTERSLSYVSVEDSTYRSIERLKKQYKLSLVPKGTYIPSEHEIYKRVQSIVREVIDSSGVYSLCTIRPIISDWDIYFMDIVLYIGGGAGVSQDFNYTEFVGFGVKKSYRKDGYSRSDVRSSSKYLDGNHPQVKSMFDNINKFFGSLPPQLIPKISIRLSYHRHRSEGERDEIGVSVITPNSSYFPLS